MSVFHALQARSHAGKFRRTTNDGGFAEWALERLYGRFYDHVQDRHGKAAALVMSVMLAIAILANPIVVPAVLL